MIGVVTFSGIPQPFFATNKSSVAPAPTLSVCYPPAHRKMEQPEKCGDESQHSDGKVLMSYVEEFEGKKYKVDLMESSAPGERYCDVLKQEIVDESPPEAFKTSDLHASSQSEK